MSETNFSKPAFLLLVILTMIFSLNVIAGPFEGKIVQKDIELEIYAIPEARDMDLEDSGARKKLAVQLFDKTPEELRPMGSMDYDEDAFMETLTTIYVKENKFRADTDEEGEKVTVIYDLESRKMITLQWEQKTAMIITMDQMEETMTGLEQGMKDMMGEYGDDMEEDETEDEFSMEPTGKTKVINGFNCELYVGTNSEGAYTHMWLNKDHQEVYESFIKVMKLFDKMMPDEMEDEGFDKETEFYAKTKGIDILTKSLSSEELEIHEKIEISEQSLSDNLFEIPDGFQQMNMQEMMKMQMQKFQDEMNKQ